MTRISTRASSGNPGRNSGGSDRGGSPPMFRVKRPRHRTTAHQLSELEALFNSDPSPTVPVKAELAKKLGMELKVVNIWFQNKRQTTKRKMLEMGEIVKGESPFDSSQQPLRKQPTRSTVLRRPDFLNRRHSSLNSAAFDAQDTDDAEEDMEDESECTRPPAARALNVVSHMVSSSSDSSSLGRRRAAILANFGPRNGRLEWVCAKNYAKFVSDRRREVPSKVTVTEKRSDCACCSRDCGCSETGDDDHEAITPTSDVPPLPNVTGRFGKPRPTVFWDSSLSSSISDLSAKDIEAAHALLDLAAGP